MATPSSQDCQLLCASIVADEIHVTEGFQPDPCYYNPVNFSAEPTIITGGAENIDACLVGTYTPLGAQSEAVVVAFRGTLMPAPNLPSILDWLQDFMAIPVAVSGLPGKVHWGFHNAVKNVWSAMLDAINAQTSGGKPLIVTGHSKGAAMATLASMMLHSAGVPVQTVTTFACPNSGDGEFAKTYKRTFTQTTYVNSLDIVPFVPPTPMLAAALSKLPIIGPLFEIFEFFNYQSASDHGIFIKSDGSTISQSANPIGYLSAVLNDLQQIESLMESGEQGIIEVLEAHMPECGGGYMTGICGDSICSSPDCKGQ